MDLINILYTLTNLQVINSYDNMNLLLAIYSEPSTWKFLYRDIEKEYKDDPKYIEAVESNKMYAQYINNEPQIYFKLTISSNTSRGFQYKTGLNVDSNQFKPYGCCSGGGLYFSKLENIHQFVGFGKYLTPIIVPKNIPIYQETHSPQCGHHTNAYEKLKAPCIFVLPRIRIDKEIANNLIVKASEKNKIFEPYKYWNSNDPQLMFKFMRCSSNWGMERAFCAVNLWFELDKKSPPFELKLKIDLDQAIKSAFKIRNKDSLECFTCKILPHYIDKNKHLVKPIVQLNLDTNSFASKFNSDITNIFTKCGAVIAGSHVLKHITNSDFTSNDIDVYIHEKNLPLFFEISKYSYTTKNYQDNIESNNIICNRYNMTDIHCVFDVWCQCQNQGKLCKNGNIRKKFIKTYQMIVVKTDPTKFIKENFDFDMCAIGFDFATGNFVNLISRDDYSVMNIQDSYIDKMTGTQADSYSNYRANKTSERIVKYINRGFNIKNYKEFLYEIIDKMCW